MKQLLLLALLAAAWAEEDVLPLAEPCDPEACQPPACRCSGTDIPGGLNERDTPQFVLLTFDDGVNVVNIETYRDLVFDRHNSNGCPVGTTFYINHEYTDYSVVNELYNHGLEIALHSMSHQTPDTYWKEATYDVMKLEFADQKAQMSHFANIPLDSIKGIRIPFLQMNGNASFQVMADYGLEYDCSMATVNQINPGLWPYTLDYASTQDCAVPECPTASIPGVWVLPMVSWVDLDGFPCSMVDSCFSVPELTDEEAWFKFIVDNFERHYKGNRSPFGFYVHQWYLASNPAVYRALERFLDMVNNLHDCFVVNSAEMIDWVKDPVPLTEYRSRPCRTWQSTACPHQSCGPLTSDHNEWGAYWMQICNECPNTYPWLGNPLGQ